MISGAVEIPGSNRFRDDALSRSGGQCRKSLLARYFGMAIHWPFISPPAGALLIGGFVTAGPMDGRRDKISLLLFFESLCPVFFLSKHVLFVGKGSG